MTDKNSERLNDINAQLRDKVLEAQKAGKPVTYIPPNDAISEYKKGVLIIDRYSDAKGYDAELGTDIDYSDLGVIVWKANEKTISEYAQIVNNEKDYHKRNDEYWKYSHLLRNNDPTGYKMSHEFDIKCHNALLEHPDDLPIHDENISLTEKQSAMSDIILSAVMDSIKTACPKIGAEDYITLKHDMIKCIDTVILETGTDNGLSCIAEKTGSIVTAILQNDNFTTYYIKNKMGMKNPVPDIIPATVWNELEYEKKVEINNAVNSGRHISYRHTSRTQKKEAKEQENQLETEKLGDFIADYPLDADVITIKGDKETKYHSRLFGLLENDNKSIFLRAICERNVTKIANPIPDSIPEAVWQQLPDVFKEELCCFIDKDKEIQSHVLGFNTFSINYIPANTKKPGILGSLLDMDCISVHWFYGGGILCGRGEDICYDVKHGLERTHSHTQA